MDESLDVSIDTSADSAAGNLDIGASPEPELAELQNEAAALEIEPLDEGTEQLYEPSTLENVTAAAMSNADSPGLAAQIIGGFAPHGADDALAQIAQMGMDAAIPAAEGFMEAVVRQHGNSPAVELNQLQIQQAIEEGAKS
jgi:hypothetical protein